MPLPLTDYTGVRFPAPVILPWTFRKGMCYTSGEMKIREMLSVMAVAFSATAMFGAAQADGVSGHYDVAAFVWPAYQPEPRWAELGIFKAGKGEWQNVWEAVPKWEGHRQPLKPLWGYENEADPKVAAKKIDAAVAHGVNVFIYDWYWYGGRPFLEDALDKGFLGAPNNGKMKFFIMWANHDVNNGWDNTVAEKSYTDFIWRGTVSMDEFRALVSRWISLYFKRPNYYRIHGEARADGLRHPQLRQGPRRSGERGRGS